MRIVMLSRLYWPHIGGVEKHIKEISKVAISKGHSVDAFTLKHDSELPTFQIDEGIRIHRKPNQLHSRLLSRILHMLPSIPPNVRDGLVERDEVWGWLLWNLPTFLRADVIHIHDVFYWYWPLRILLFWKRTTITFHGFEAGRLPTKKAKHARQLAARFTNGNLCIGSFIEKWYGTQPTMISYGAANCQGFLQHSTKRKDFSAVFVGRLEKDTGIETYLAIAKQHNKMTLDVYGQGPLESLLSSAGSTISYQGMVLNACSVFSQYEFAFASSYLSILEAMQSKTLVVAVASDPLKMDYLNCHPMAYQMVILQSANEFKKVLNLSETVQHTMVETAYQWAKDQTWEKQFDDYLVLWKHNP